MLGVESQQLVDEEGFIQIVMTSVAGSGFQALPTTNSVREEIIMTIRTRAKIFLSTALLTFAANNLAATESVAVDEQTREQYAFATKLHAQNGNLVYASDNMLIWDHGACGFSPIYWILLLHIEPDVPVTETEHIKSLLKYRSTKMAGAIEIDESANGNGEIARAIFQHCPEAEQPRVNIELKGFRLSSHGGGYGIPEEAYEAGYKPSDQVSAFANQSVYNRLFLLSATLFRLNDALLANQMRKPKEYYDDWVVSLLEPSYVLPYSVNEILSGKPTRKLSYKEEKTFALGKSQAAAIAAIAAGVAVIALTTPDPYDIGPAPKEGCRKKEVFELSGTLAPGASLEFPEYMCFGRNVILHGMWCYRIEWVCD